MFWQRYGAEATRRERERERGQCAELVEMKNFLEFKSNSTERNVKCAYPNVPIAGGTTAMWVQEQKKNQNEIFHTLQDINFESRAIYRRWRKCTMIELFFHVYFISINLIVFAHMQFSGKCETWKSSARNAISAPCWVAVLCHSTALPFASPPTRQPQNNTWKKCFPGGEREHDDEAGGGRETFKRFKSDCRLFASLTLWWFFEQLWVWSEHWNIYFI